MAKLIKVGTVVFKGSAVVILLKISVTGLVTIVAIVVIIGKVVGNLEVVVIVVVVVVVVNVVDSGCKIPGGINLHLSDEVFGPNIASNTYASNDPAVSPMLYDKVIMLPKNFKNFNLISWYFVDDKIKIYLIVLCFLPGLYSVLESLEYFQLDRLLDRAPLKKT